MPPPHRHRPLRSTAVLLLLGLALGCAGRGSPVAAPTSSTDAEATELARSVERLEQDHWIAMLRSLRITSHAYDRMTEARSTLMDAVSWWATITPAPAEQPPPATVDASPPLAAQGLAEATSCQEPPPDPYAAIDEAPASAASQVVGPTHSR